MRLATTIAAILLTHPVAVWGQAQTTSGSGHFEGWLSDEYWGADKLTFDATFSFRRAAVTFTVAKNGFGWHRAFTQSKETFTRWENVTAWCSAPGTVIFRTRQTPPLRAGIYDLQPEDLATIVDGYFKKYAPEVERTGRVPECTLAGLSGPDPAARSRIVELLEAASSKNP